MANEQRDVARTIEAMSEQYVRHFNAGDADRMVSEFYAEDAKFLPPNHPMASGRSQIRDTIKGFLGAGLGELSIRPVQVVASGDLAYSVGTYSLGKPAPDTGKYVEVHRRQPDGSWTCVVDIFNSDQSSP